MVKVTDRFYIDANANCYVLKEKTIIKDESSKNYGQEKYEDRGYYTSLEGCLMGILKINTREYITKVEEKSIQDVVEEIRKTEEYIKSLNLKI